MPTTLGIQKAESHPFAAEKPSADCGCCGSALEPNAAPCQVELTWCQPPALWQTLLNRDPKTWAETRVLCNACYETWAAPAAEGRPAKGYGWRMAGVVAFWVTPALALGWYFAPAAMGPTGWKWWAPVGLTVAVAVISCPMSILFWRVHDRYGNPACRKLARKLSARDGVRLTLVTLKKSK